MSRSGHVSALYAQIGDTFFIGQTLDGLFQFCDADSANLIRHILMYCGIDYANDLSLHIHNGSAGIAAAIDVCGHFPIIRVRQFHRDILSCHHTIAHTATSAGGCSNSHNRCTYGALSHGASQFCYANSVCNSCLGCTKIHGNHSKSCIIVDSLYGSRTGLVCLKGNHQTICIFEILGICQDQKLFSIVGYQNAGYFILIPADTGLQTAIGIHRSDTHHGFLYFSCQNRELSVVLFIACKLATGCYHRVDIISKQRAFRGSLSCRFAFQTFFLLHTL